jgi:hypothetical protein
MTDKETVKALADIIAEAAYKIEDKFPEINDPDKERVIMDTHDKLVDIHDYLLDIFFNPKDVLVE